MHLFFNVAVFFSKAPDVRNNGTVAYATKDNLHSRVLLLGCGFTHVSAKPPHKVNTMAAFQSSGNLVGRLLLPLVLLVGFEMAQLCWLWWAPQSATHNTAMNLQINVCFFCLHRGLSFRIVSVCNTEVETR